MLTRQLPLLLLLSPLSSFAWICFPPPHLLPTSSDCLTLIAGMDYLSNLPRNRVKKRWGRHFPSTPMTERLPKWYYIEEHRQPSTCAIVVDVQDAYSSTVESFRLEDVTRAGMEVYAQCLLQKGQIGLDFPSEEGHAFAKMERMDVPPILRLGAALGEGRGVRRVVLPGGQGVLIVSDAPSGGRRNVSVTR